MDNEGPAASRLTPAGSSTSRREMTRCSMYFSHHRCLWLTGATFGLQLEA